MESRFAVGTLGLSPVQVLNIIIIMLVQFKSICSICSRPKVPGISSSCWQLYREALPLLYNAPREFPSGMTYHNIVRAGSTGLAL